MRDTGRRKIIYLSGTRADFGLMQSTLQQIAAVADLSVAVTGMHLDAAYGRTVGDIRAAGLAICGEIPFDTQTRTRESMSIGVGVCLEGVTTLLAREKPDMLVLLGDRGEMLAGAIAALHLGIVSVQIHGGERSGTVDESIRHAISKLVSYHFVATDESRARLIRMGEWPEHVFVTGAPGLDALSGHVLLTTAECRAEFGLPPDQRFALAVFHPVVQQAAEAFDQAAEVLRALGQLGLPVVWAEPNSDAGSAGVLAALDVIGLPPGSHRRRHLRRDLFCAAMEHCAVMVGNSSAGIIEAATFGTPVVNIGNRQRLRERNDNVQDVAPRSDDVAAAMAHALNHGRWPCDNRYGDGHTGPRIARLLASLSLAPSVLDKVNAY